MTALVAAGLALTLAVASAQDEPVPAEHVSKPPVALTFTPPDLEGDIVLGIYDAAGKLVRAMRFEPGAAGLKIDTNGYIASWDGRDDQGRPCAAGRYSARGYMVDAAVSVEGVAFHFNDWYAQDNVAASSVSLPPDGPAPELAIQVAPNHEPPRGADPGPLTALPQPDGTLRWDRRPPPTREPVRRDLDAGRYPPDASWADGDPSKKGKISGPARAAKAPPHLEGELLAAVNGRDETLWGIVEIDGRNVVRQFAPDGEVLRELRVPADEPQPSQILASPAEDLILVKEKSPDDAVQRVRMLRRAGNAAPDQDGRSAADWEVVFERSLEHCRNFDVVGGKLVADGGPARQPANEITVRLTENVLEPRENELKLEAVGTGGGSALSSLDGLRLISVSSKGGWFRFAMVAGARPGEATLYQGNDCVVEEFALKNLDRIAAFDAGAFLLAPAQ